MKEKYAVIDIGSNTIRLVIFQKNESGRLKEIQNVKVMARLRAHLSEGNTLLKKGIDRLVKTLKGFKEVIDEHKLNEVMCVATATLRQAKNQQDILDHVFKVTGLTIQILTEEEEAYYGYTSVIHSISIEEGISVDLGGGSTEITYFQDRELRESVSLPFGGLSLKQQFVKDDVPTSEELTKIRQFLLEQFDTLPWLKHRGCPIVMIGGSARNVVQLDQARKKYPLTGLHQYIIYRDDIRAIKQELIGLSPKELMKIDDLSSDRYDTILQGIEVFDCLSEYIQAPHLILSRKGLREGILFEKFHPNPSEMRQVIANSLHELAIDYEIDQQMVHYVSKTVLSLVESLKDRKELPFELTKRDLDLLRLSAFVYNMGQYIDNESSSQHTFYLLANRTIDGLYHKEKIKMALMASYKNKPLFKQYLHPFKKWFAKSEKVKLSVLGALLKLGYGLHSTGRNIIKSVHIEEVGKTLQFIFVCTQNGEPEKYAALKEVKQLEKLLKRSIVVQFQLNQV